MIVALAADATSSLSASRQKQPAIPALQMDRLPYPHPTSSDVSRRMQANRRTETKPEIAVRSALHALGLRFRKDHPIRLTYRIVRPDIVFTRQRLAVFIDGCFWHRCPIHGNVPRANNDYWAPKLERNVARDRAVDRALGDAGWQVLRAWEHEDASSVATRVRSVLQQADGTRQLRHPRQ